ncbi:MAG: hypothetical protein GY702_06890 [Desulfobulbaceae bacterium]|nr:hypothetical protein [Desulfobulbaceae bacterium]
MFIEEMFYEGEVVDKVLLYYTDQLLIIVAAADPWPPFVDPSSPERKGMLWKS